jgi:hypothetical protein
MAARDLVIEERRVLGIFKQKPPLRRQTEIKPGHGSCSGLVGPRYHNSFHVS